MHALANAPLALTLSDLERSNRGQAYFKGL